MNKNELIASVASATSLSKADAGRAVDSVFDAIASSLSNGDAVRLVGFGTFAVSKRSARIGRNPQTGKPIKIPAKKVARFTPGKALKDAIN